MTHPIYAHYYTPNNVWILSYSKTEVTLNNALAYLYPDGTVRKENDEKGDAGKEGIYIGQLSLVGF